MRPRAYVGILGGVIILLSSVAHSILGWRQLGADLVKAGAPDDLILGLEIGWHFAGVAMVAFGIIVVGAFAKLLRGQPFAMLPVVVIAVTYVMFGAYSLLISKNPFFFIFIIPGALIALGVTGQRHV